ncbi:MAG: ATPase domain-containing protein [Deltaproteobacteria bacterium]|nr:ATPase domain-containing protein [Deltaproteobacteria bacterium]
MKENKKSPVFTAWKRLEALVGRGGVRLFATDPPLARMPTGVDALDGLLDGGLPRGRLVELFGPPGSGKTTLALRLCAAVHRQGGVAAVVDVDHGLDRYTLQRCGVDGDKLVIARPEGGEAALHIVDELLASRAAEVIVVDSVAALVPKAELLSLTGGAPAGHHARLMSQAMRRLTLQAAKSRAVVVFVNQLRRNWGEDGKGVDITTGGNALPYAAATRIALQRSGSCTRMTLVKARFGRQGHSVVVDDVVAVVPEAPRVAA